MGTGRSSAAPLCSSTQTAVPPLYAGTKKQVFFKCTNGESSSDEDNYYMIKGTARIPGVALGGHRAVRLNKSISTGKTKIPGPIVNLLIAAVHNVPPAANLTQGKDAVTIILLGDKTNIE